MNANSPLLSLCSFGEQNEFNQDAMRSLGNFPFCKTLAKSQPSREKFLCRVSGRPDYATPYLLWRQLFSSKSLKGIATAEKNPCPNSLRAVGKSRDNVVFLLSFKSPATASGLTVSFSDVVLTQNAFQKQKIKS